MPTPQMQDLSFSLKFGGGLNSAASEDDVLVNEASNGQNFSLDLKNKNLSPRNPVERLGRAPNGQRINGFVGHVDSDGIASILVQAGDKIYSWSESADFSLVGSCSSNARLRGHQHHYWPLDDVTFITDLALQENILTWNGSALATFTHNLAGNFKAKYCWVDRERAHFSNVVSGATATPHMMVVSEVSDASSLSVSDRPSSSLGAADPYYLLTPDLRPINGALGYYGGIVVSSDRGSLYNITGSDATDTAIEPFYPRSYAVGRESMAYAGNDVVFGRLGRIETLVSTQNYGDVATDDLTSPIKNRVADAQDWLIAYNPRTQKIYFYADGEQTVWEYSKDVALSSDVSPWVPIVTENSFAMTPTTMMVMVDPDDGLEYTYMGDTSGYIYKIEGAQGGQDCGSNDIKTVWRSGTFKLPQSYVGHKFDGYISYRAGADTTVTVRFIFGGSYSSIEEATVPLTSASGGVYFGEEVYFGGTGVYFGTQFNGSFKREALSPAGQSEEFQIEIEHEGTEFFEISEIGVRFTGKTNP